MYLPHFLQLILSHIILHLLLLTMFVLYQEGRKKFQTRGRQQPQPRQLLLRRPEIVWGESMIQKSHIGGSSTSTSSRICSFLNRGNDDDSTCTNNNPFQPTTTRIENTGNHLIEEKQNELNKIIEHQKVEIKRLRECIEDLERRGASRPTSTQQLPPMPLPVK